MVFACVDPRIWKRFTMPFVFRWFVNWNRSCQNDRLRNSLYKIQNNFLRDSETVCLFQNPNRNRYFHESK